MMNAKSLAVLISRRLGKWPWILLIACLWAAPARAQFRDDFNGPVVKTDPDGINGWTFFTGDGKAAMDFRQGGRGYASIFVDAGRDQRNVWWALIERQVLKGIDLEQLKQPGLASSVGVWSVFIPGRRKTINRWRWTLLPRNNSVEG